jgi:hypothetical protein
MYRLFLDILIAIAIVVIVMLLAATLVGHAAPEPWQMGCKIRTATGVATVVVAALSVGSCIGILVCGLLRGTDQ